VMFGLYAVHSRCRPVRVDQLRVSARKCFYMTFSFTSKENPTNLIIYKGSLLPTLLPAPRRNLLTLRFKDDREVEKNCDTVSDSRGRRLLST
jgi:hypothetical protein